MKRKFFLMCIACASAMAFAQTAEQRRISTQYSCILSAKQGFGRGRKETAWASSYGSHDKTQSISLKYTVDVKGNMKEDSYRSRDVIYMA